MTIVTLVQHAEKEPMPGDPGLTPLGSEQARRTAAALACLSVPAAVYSSPLKRALQTASVFAEQFDLPVQRDDRLRERLNWNGDRSLESFLADWERTTKDRDFAPASGDSSRQAAERMLEALRDVANRHHDERVVVVTHGGVTVDVLRTLLGDEAIASTAPDLLTAGVPCCGLTTLTRLGESWFVNRIASVEHLTGDAAPDSWRPRRETGPREQGEPSMSRLYVVISGPPGSGKTTLARPLAHALDLPLIAKDRIKESLLDSLGVGDLEWSRLLGRATMSLMYRLAADAGAAVLESTWSPELAPAALAALDAPIVEVYCSCPPELAEARYRERASTRHPGHHDAKRVYDDRWTNDRPLGVGPLVVVDTSRPVDVLGVAEEIRAATGRRPAQGGDRHWRPLPP